MYFNLITLLFSKVKWSEKVTKEQVLECIGEKRTVLNNNIIFSYTELVKAIKQNLSDNRYGDPTNGNPSLKKMRNQS